MSSILGGGFDRRLITVPLGIVAIGAPLLGMIFGEGDFQKECGAVAIPELLAGSLWVGWKLTREED